ncbi:MAG: hypothetical protein JHC25_07795 [Thermodesulfobacterium sp.]|nr:hypothetical protein [Thermodesulfobacterium sp.]
MSCGITRRELFSALGGLPLLSLLPEVSFADVDLLPTKCFSCSLGICFCGKPPRPAIKASYWFPVGFLEANKECEFMTSMIPIVGSVVSAPLQALCRSVPIVLGTSGVKTGPTGAGQDYMRFHARWYSLPKPLHSWVEKILLTVHLCPCIGLNWIFEKVLNVPVISEGLKVYQELMNKVAEVERTVKESVKQAVGPILDKVKSFIPVGSGGGGLDFSKAQNILSKINELRQWIPLVITEPFSPLWLLDVLSVDNATAPVIANAIHTLVSSYSPPLGAISCPFLVQELIKRNLIPRELVIKGVSVLDLEFICVGYWGHGYPRIGVVRHDDPYIARLLALARFHHLFSKTFPIIPVPISMDPGQMKYQIWSPFVSDCFGVGRWGVPTLEDIKDLTNTDQLVQKLKSIGWETIKSALVRGVKEQERKMMVIVWKKEEKCCC